ncbi:MAG: clostripain-related cysteine peptidase [Clostridia bacterium]|nr:clostripain-related cysteine peptidase [Clostridia bacterium]
MKNSHNRFYICFAIFLILLELVLVGCNSYQTESESTIITSNTSEYNRSYSETELNRDDFTLLIYMCGSSLESKNGSASDDISELLSADIPQKVNVVLETGGSERWKKHGISADKLQRYKVSDNKLELIEENKLSSMGDSSTLRKFIDWGTQEFPAKKTALIFWDHGGGFLKGICKDEIYNNEWLTVQEFDIALKTSSFPHKFEFIGFDACLMANYETALVVSEYSNYMIASEDIESTGGWNYKLIANSLGSGNEIKTILKSFSEENCGKTDYTLSAIDLTQLEKVKCVFKSCIDKGKIAFERAINSADSIGTFSSCIYDMGNLAGLLNIDFDFSNCITVVSSDSMKNLSGISFCFPESNSKAMEEYIQNCTDDEYTTFLKNHYFNV